MDSTVQRRLHFSAESTPSTESSWPATLAVLRMWRACVQRPAPHTTGGECHCLGGLCSEAARFDQARPGRPAHGLVHGLDMARPGSDWYRCFGPVYADDCRLPVAIAAPTGAARIVVQLPSRVVQRRARPRRSAASNRRCGFKLTACSTCCGSRMLPTAALSRRALSSGDSIRPGTAR